MIRLMYFSTATTDFSRSDIDMIVQDAMPRNEERGVTGLLAFNGRNFCQVLEGEEETVNELVQVIRKDARHAGFKVLGSKPIQNRIFEGWSIRHVKSLDFSEAVQAMEA